MVCTTSKSIKLFRAIYIKATGNYGVEPDDSELATLFAAAKDLKVSSGPSEISIEQQESTLPNYGENLRNDHSQFDYFKVSGGNLLMPHHVSMLAAHSDLFKSGFGSLTEGVGSSTCVAELTDVNEVTVQTAAGATFTIGNMIKIGGSSIHTVTGISTDTLTFTPDIPDSITFAIGSTVVELDTWNPQCLNDNNYYHFLIWDADEYWLLTYVKPSFTQKSDDGGVPREWQMNISAYSARRISSSYESAMATLFSTIALDTFTVATLNNKTNIAFENIANQDIVSLSLNIERENTRWETGVNEKGAVGSINDITKISGELVVFQNKSQYHGYLNSNSEINISFQSADASFAFYAPKAKLTNPGSNPITEDSGQNVATFGVSYNEDQASQIAVYLGDI